jgi:hypothetical protein
MGRKENLFLEAKKRRHVLLIGRYTPLPSAGVNYLIIAKLSSTVPTCLNTCVNPQRNQ